MMKKLIVSLPSYPARIACIGKVLDTICNQTVRPDKTILYLAESQFLENSVDIDTYKYDSCGFEIRWSPKDLRSYKKFYYAMQDFPDDFIVTIDDDFYYAPTMLEELLAQQKKFPNTVIARRGSRIVFKDGKTLSDYENWYSFSQLERPAMDNFATSGGGTLFPPHLLKNEIFNDKVFMKFAPFADDLWLKVIQILSDVPVAFSSGTFNDIPFNKGVAEGLFASHNQGGGNGRQLSALMEHYDSEIGISLIPIIQRDVFLLEADLRKKTLSDAIAMLSAWLECNFGENKFYIFGAGKVANLFYSAILRLDLKERLICAFVSTLDGNTSQKFNLRRV